MNHQLKSRFILVMISLLGISPYSFSQSNVENVKKDIEWVELEPTPDPEGVFKGVNTYAIMPKLLDNFPEGTQLHKSFILEKQEYLLGEPIMIELRTWLEGPGTWKERVWFNDLGQTDYFVFLLRHEDGEWVNRPDLGRDSIDGWGNDQTVSQLDPHHRWSLLQFSRAITRPGRYKLYCVFQNFDWGQNVPNRLYFKSPPLALFNYYSEELRQYYNSLDEEMNKLTERKEAWRQISYLWNIQRTLCRAEVYAEFSITIREGNDEEIDTMVQATLKSIREGTSHYVLGQDITLIQQDYFLGLEEDLYKNPHSLGNFRRGLFIHPSPKATVMLFKMPKGYNIVHSYKTTMHLQLVKNVEYLSENADEPVRTQANEWLAKRKAHFEQEK